MLRTMLDAIGDWPAALVLAGAAVVLALESGVLPGVVLPGSTTLVALGVWSAASGTHPVLPIAVGATASVAGALHGWRRGSRRRGLPGGQRWLRARVDPAVRWARSWLSTRGPAGTVAVLAVAHWIAVSRTLAPRVAGGAGVPLRLVGPVVAVSGAAWATTVVLLARVLGERAATGAGWVPAVGAGVVVVVVLARSLRARARGTTPAPAAPGPD